MDITSDGELFFGQATSGNPVQHVVLPEWILAKGKIGNAGSVESVIAQRKIIRVRHADARAVHADRRGRRLQLRVRRAPSRKTARGPRNGSDAVFCTEPILDIIHFEKLKPQGADLHRRNDRSQDREWLRAQDFWFFPIDVQFGPDGAMYVLDFYNPIVAHSDTRGPKHSKSGATVRPDREHYFGRIYRIQHEQATSPAVPDLSEASAQKLVEAFSHPNKRMRFTAQRLLLERNDAATAVPALTALASSSQPEAARILALWTLQQLRALDAAVLQAALADEQPGIQKTALLIVEALGSANTADMSPLLDSEDARVRLLALRAMASSAAHHGIRREAALHPAPVG